MLPLTKTLDPATDYPELAPELVCVDAADLSTQHPHRRFEYAMALRAHNRWSQDTAVDVRTVLDVGGAGSPFHTIAACGTGAKVHTVDPLINTGIEAYSGEPAGCVFAISVIEHVPNYRPFLRALANNLHPGGLCFLTTDYWNCEGPDVAHFHWMRERIYNRDSIRKLLLECGALGLYLYGGTDWAYHGDHVYNYSFLSLALIKERRHARAEAASGN